MSEYVIADYLLPTITKRSDAEKVADQIVYGQTLGFKPQSEEADLQAYTATLQALDETPGGGYRLSVAFPEILFGSDLAGMLTVLFGKVSFAPGIVLTDLSFSPNWLQGLPGSKHGLQGLRLLSKRQTGPLFMAILKPGIGPDVTALANQVRALADGGFDFVKDDEVCIDLRLDHACRRVEAVSGAVGDRLTYVTHLTGPAHELLDRARSLQNAGAQAFLFCPFTYGFSLLQMLASHVDIKVPIFVHPALSGIMTQPLQGIASSLLLGLLPRLAGADAVLFPSPYGSIALPKDEALLLHDNLMRPLGRLPAVASVPSAGITVEDVPKLLHDFGRDVVINAGTGVAKAGHDLTSGAKAFRAKSVGGEES